MMDIVVKYAMFQYRFLFRSQENTLFQQDITDECDDLLTIDKYQAIEYLLQNVYRCL